MKKTVLTSFAIFCLLSTAFLTGFKYSIKASPTLIRVPEDYEKIQWAVSNASDGGTIYVSSGTYHEHVVVDKSVSLVGEDRETTIIDGNGEGIVVFICASGASVSNFTIQQSGGGGPPVGCGIFLSHSNDIMIFGNKIVNNAGSGIHSVASNSCVIEQNIIRSNTHNSHYQVAGIYLLDLKGTMIYGNHIENNADGVYLSHSHYNTLEENYLINNGISIYLSGSRNNNVANNSVVNSFRGICLWESCNNNKLINNMIADSTWHNLLIYSSQNCVIIENNFTNGHYGIEITDELRNPPRFDNNSIYHNCFVNNEVQAAISESVNIWDNGAEGNYWSDYKGTDDDGDGVGDVPYGIDKYNQDNCPLMTCYIPPQEMQVSWVLYGKLLEKYNGLLVNYKDLFYNIYKNLNITYDNLQADYNSLDSTYNNLSAIYNELKSKQEATTSELSNIRNLMYIFVTTTIILAATTAYVALRKPKIKN